jgi:hypothetical protein
MKGDAARTLMKSAAAVSATIQQGSNDCRRPEGWRGAGPSSRRGCPAQPPQSEKALVFQVSVRGNEGNDGGNGWQRARPEALCLTILDCFGRTFRQEIDQDTEVQDSGRDGNGGVVGGASVRAARTTTLIVPASRARRVLRSKSKNRSACPAHAAFDPFGGNQRRIETVARDAY